MVEKNRDANYCEYAEIVARDLKDVACKRFLAKLNNLESLKGWIRDDSYLGIRAKNHIEYKLGEPLISRDGMRAYEFLIEFDVNDPSIGIYYGVKGLILGGNSREQVEKLVKEFYGFPISEYNHSGELSLGKDSLQDILARYLNATFPGKDFSQRFRFTDNNYNNTFWPFWIAADPEEDIICETARAVSIIKRVYKERINDGLLELSHPECKISNDLRKRLQPLGEVPTESKELQSGVMPPDNKIREEYIRSIRFTREAYEAILKKLKAWGEVFEQLISMLKDEKIIVESVLLEKGLVIGKRKKQEVARYLGKFWELYGKWSGEYDKKRPSNFFGDLTSIFIQLDIKPMNPETFRKSSHIKKDEKDYEVINEKYERVVRIAELKCRRVLK